MKCTLLIMLMAAGLWSAGCDSSAGADGSAARGDLVVAQRAPVDADLSAERIKLLELAFDTASAIPLQPHIKDRSKMQELVVTTCLALDQPARALRYAEEIENWRRGACFASYAAYCAERGFRSEAETYAEKAAEVAGETEDWRRATIHVAIAQTYLWLDEPKKAAVFDADVTDSERGKSHLARVQVIDEALFSAQVDALDALVATGIFDHVRNALQTFAQLYDRFYEDGEKRELAEARIRRSWAMFPHMIRIELLRELVDAAVHHEDMTNARRLVREQEDLVAELNWKAEYRVPLLAHLARQQHAAGDVEGARRTAAASLEAFEKGRGSIINIYRAGGLRPLAEAYLGMGNHDTARRIYALAIEEGVENPNARPQAEDLCATLCSMALHGFEPDDELWRRMREVREGLDHPW